jgi:hypothetical protein
MSAIVTRRTGDELGHDTAGGLDTSGERCDIEEEEVLGLLGRVSSQDGGLDSGSVGNGLIGVDRLVGLLETPKKVSHSVEDEARPQSKRTLPLKKSETSF